VSGSVDVRAGYDSWAADYDRFDNPMVALAALAFARADLPLKDAGFLDIGCGTGRNLGLARARGAASLVGIDGSRGMLAQARARLDGIATLVEADLAGTWPPLPGAPFDVACISLVLEHFPAVDPIVAQAATLLKSGGVLFAAELHADLAAAGTGAHFEKDGRIHRLPSFGHDAAEYQAALAAAGFVACEIAEWLADDHVARAPKLAKHRGKRVLASFVARKA
jgi:SAM-dependent methyltransferase